ncbi:probable tRNA(His) guanylyltransferase [Trichonephila inaurata madagascariensis]|uniref:tRNA(His) guanylyltransferase n=1 Tax=Trichonephila inaurata madagascariensis TaxID=2747483 RepID=A0A8X6JR75_9ARAC|nr:probable tRNA(His) guanylyltransferase [Trichonephila inaurata madagascariensis]
MAKSMYEYVKNYENLDIICPNTWIVVRIDGKNFHKLSDTHKFVKPNDQRSLDLMNKAAKTVFKEIHDVILAYGQSDEYSFIFERQTKLYKRRSSKILTNVCSLFTSSFVYYWKTYFPNDDLLYPPSFDGRVVTYPTNKNLRDYLSWRQTDCHINNLYNTTFWALVQRGGLSPKEAEEKIRYTVSAEKNEILFSQFSINYNKEKEQFKKGTFIIRSKVHKQVVMIDDYFEEEEGLYLSFIDVIGNKFWQNNPHILSED